MRACRVSISRVLGKHIGAHVVHNLDTLYLGVYFQGFLQFFLNQPPGIALHTAGGVDDKDDIFAVHREYRRRIGRLFGVVF